MAYKIPPRPRILLSNDDGIYAPGLKVLEEIARQISDDVWVVAPLEEQSGAGHSLSLRTPLRIRQMEEKRFAVEGTPTDCVLLALNNLMAKNRPHLVLSGVNNGANLGEDVTYSGTIAAAMEATLLGVPAIALSQLITRSSPPLPSPVIPRWEVATQFGPSLIKDLCRLNWPEDMLINVNFPDCAIPQVKGISVTRQGRRKVGEELIERTDPRGQSYYWIGAMVHEEPTKEGSDLAAISQNRISVTPLHLDLTHTPTLQDLKEILKS
jgi:5'-nucleotidase